MRRNYCQIEYNFHLPIETFSNTEVTWAVRQSLALKQLQYLMYLFYFIKNYVSVVISKQYLDKTSRYIPEHFCMLNTRAALPCMSSQILHSAFVPTDVFDSKSDNRN